MGSNVDRIVRVAILSLVNVRSHPRSRHFRGGESYYISKKDYENIFVISAPEIFIKYAG